MTPVQIIESIDAHKAPREWATDYFSQNPTHIPKLVKWALSNRGRFSDQSAWVVELLVMRNTLGMMEYLNPILSKIHQIQSDSVKRCLSKVLMVWVKQHYTKLETLQKNKLIDIGWRWLVQDEKVATQCYAMYMLEVLAKEHPWISPELMDALMQNMPHKSAAYKAVARKVIGPIKKH